MKTLEDLQRAANALDLPPWVERVVVADMWDMDGEPALDALILIRDGHEQVLMDGEALEQVWILVTDSLHDLDGERWAYFRYGLANELGAA